LKTDAYLFDIRSVIQFNPADFRPDFAGPGDRRFWGKNPEFGAAVSYYLQQPAKELKITVRNASGGLVRDMSGDALKEAKRPGINRIQWDLRHQPLPRPRVAPTGGGGGGGGTLNGPFVLPGDYRVTLSVDGKIVGSRSVHVNGDPIITITDADRKTLHDTALSLHELQQTADEAADAVRALSEQIVAVEDLMKPATAPAAVKTTVDDLARRIAALRRPLAVPVPGQLPLQVVGVPDGGEPPLRAQIASLKAQIMASTSAPTEVQMRLTSEMREDLAKLIGETNSVITAGIPALYRILTDNNMLTGLKPIKVVAAAPPQGM
jgi:hypothetical protein